MGRMDLSLPNVLKFQAACLEGRTIQEARENIKDAIDSCLSVILEDHLKEKRKGGI